MRRDLPAGRGKLRGLPAVTQHGSIWTCSWVPVQAIAPAQALLQCLQAEGWRPRRPRHRCRHLPAGSGGGFAEEASRLPLLVLLWSGLAPLPSSHPYTRTPVPRGSPLLYPIGVNGADLPTPCCCITTGSCQGEATAPLPAHHPWGSPRGGSSENTPWQGWRGAERGEGSGQPGRLPRAPAAGQALPGHGPQAGRIAKQPRRESKEAGACRGAAGNPGALLAAAQQGGAWWGDGKGCPQG